MAVGSMAEVTDFVVKVCPLLTLSALILRRTAGRPPKGGSGRRVFFDF